MTAKQMLPLNVGQQGAADGYLNFMLDDTKVGFIISGPAGVGKTTLMQFMIDKAQPAYEDTCKILGMKPKYDAVYMTATTNKAAEVLSNACGRPTTTIHAFLGLTVKEDYTTGKLNLTKGSNWRVHENKVLFIDECSTIDTDLFTFLIEGTHNCKIVFVGDREQLAPVMEALSPVYLQNYDFYELTEQMRNNGSPDLMALCSQLRDQVVSGEFNPIKIVPGVIDYLDGPAMEQKIDEYFKDLNPDARIVAFTNARVMEYNDHIRSIRGLPPHFTQGEKAVNNTSIKLGNYQLSVEEEVTFLEVGEEESTEILPGTKFYFRRCKLRSDFGGTHYDVKVPTDRDHMRSLIRYFASKNGRNWTLYWHIKQTYPDLRPVEAGTIHKAQGSTYDTVFVDLGDVSRCTIADQTARMLYVACSRARSRVFFYGDLADKYGGLIK